MALARSSAPPLPGTRLPVALALLLSMSLGGCTCADDVDRAAKKRIFSPEDPPQAVASASEVLQVREAEKDPALTRRILEMGAAEVTERLGPHKHSASVSFEWTGAGRSTKLVESRVLIAGPGGVSGDFHATSENSRDQGLEVMRVKGEVFARNRYGKFRQRLRDRGIAERERDETAGAVRDLNEIFHRRIKLVSKGTVTHEGREAHRFEVAMGPEEQPVDTGVDPPRVQQKDGGADETTRRRLTFYDKGQPRALAGEVVVDAKTAVILKAHIDGRLTVASQAEPAELRMVVDVSLSDIGKDPRLKPPTEFLPDQDKPAGIADALERFGLAKRRGADGGSPAAAAEPEDDTP